MANLRSAYAEAKAEYLGTNASANSSSYNVQQGSTGWSVDSTALPSDITSTELDKLKNATKGSTFTVTYDGTNVTVTVTAAP